MSWIPYAVAGAAGLGWYVIKRTLRPSWTENALRVPMRSQAQRVALKELVQPDAVTQLVRGWNVGSATELANLWETLDIEYEADPLGGDFWCPPLVTLGRGKGDCEDLAILTVSIALAMGIVAEVVVGTTSGSGHAWVEGIDLDGAFHFEPTNRSLRRYRPESYQVDRAVSSGVFESYFV